MAQKQIALSLRQLCSDPDSQAYIVREKQCMSGLMDLLSKDDDPEVLLITLQALSFLSSAPSNREPLVQTYPQLVVRLVSLSTSNDDTMQRVTSLANTILEHLESYINQEDGKKKQVPSRRQTMAPGIGRTDLYEGRRRGSSFTPKYQHEIILRVSDMMSERQRADVERSLIAVKGVTSVTINMHMKQVVVYTGLAEDRILPLLIAAVATVGLEATRYRTSIAGANVATTTPASHRGSTSFANNDENATPSYLNSQTPSYPNAQTPSYLNPATAKPAYQTKEAAPMPTPTVTSTTPSYPSYATATPGAPTTPSYASPASAYYGAVTPHQGFEDSTLKARYAAKKNVEEAKKVQESRVKSLFGSVASYFW